MEKHVDRKVRRKAKNKSKLANAEKEKVSKSPLGLKSVLIFLAASVITALFLELVPHPKVFPDWLSSEENASEEPQQAAPSYALQTANSSLEKHLVHVVNVLQRFGYRRVGLNDNWNLLWAHDYPFPKLPQLNDLGKHQVVNHFPGGGYLTSKVDLSTSQLSFQPRAFRLPEEKEEFLEYVRENPESLFVQKNNKHRHIKLKEASEIDLLSNDSFVQEFIQRPFLVDGHKFDIGVYVVITSFNPLRVYIYTNNVMFRFCPEKYYPFDAENVNKYVVAGNFLPPWKIPALERYFNTFGGNRRTSFEAYLRDMGLDPSRIWPQVEHIIRKTILSKEPDIISVLSSYNTHNFFELLRFDLFIDENLNVYLMEANMSPNLSSDRVQQNAPLFEQVLYSVLNLVGIRPLSATSGLKFRESSDMITIDTNLATDLNKCAENNCDESCDKEECDLCLQCLNDFKYKTLEEAFQEHLHRVSMKRIFPKPIHNLKQFNLTDETIKLSERNSWMTRWFYNKCLFDSTWCH